MALGRKELPRLRQRSDSSTLPDAVNENETATYELLTGIFFGFLYCVFLKRFLFTGFCVLKFDCEALRSFALSNHITIVNISLKIHYLEQFASHDWFECSTTTTETDPLDHTALSHDATTGAAS